MTDTPWEIRAHPDVLSEIEALRDQGRRSLAERIVDKLGQLSEDPYQPRTGMDIRKLRGTDGPVYRLRVGSHRVIFEVAKDERVVYVTQVVKRESAYD